MPGASGVGAVAPCILVYAPRERARALARSAFPRRRARVVAVRGADECAAVLRSTLVDAVIVEVVSPGEEGWRVGALARDFPSLPFFGLLPLRAGDGPALAQCAALEFSDVLVEGVDDAALRALVFPLCFSTRFAAALREPPPALGLSSPVQQAAWRCIVAQAGGA